jgi:hypothetical protein
MEKQQKKTIILLNLSYFIFNNNENPSVLALINRKKYVFYETSIIFYLIIF